MLEKSIPLDQELYEQVKKEISAKYKHSAYRSGLIVKEYKRRGGRYQGNKKGPLDRWFKEKWVNQAGGVGYTDDANLYRPTYRIDKDTPLTWSELSQQEIEKAGVIKRVKGRVYKFRPTKASQVSNKASKERGSPKKA